MKTIFLLPSYISDSVSFIAYQYVETLRRRGYDVGITSVRHSPLRNSSLQYVSRWKIFKCKVLVTNLFLPDLLGYFISRLHPSTKWVAFLHCDVVGGLAAERKSFAKVKAWLWRKVLSRADLVISPSLYALKNLTAIKNSVIIHHCISPDIEYYFRSNAGLPISKTHIITKYPLESCSSSYVFIGRDTPAKRLFVLLSLLRIDPKCTIKVIGKITFSQEKIEQLTEEEFSRCTFYGYQEDPYQFLNNEDVVICPSGREGFGLIPLECIARNIPVAVINEGVFRELYGDTSIVYSKISELPLNVSQLSKDIQMLKEKYIGVGALNERVDRLISVLFDDIETNLGHSNKLID